MYVWHCIRDFPARKEPKAPSLRWQRAALLKTSILYPSHWQHKEWEALHGDIRPRELLSILAKPESNWQPWPSDRMEKLNIIWFTCLINLDNSLLRLCLHRWKLTPQTLIRSLVLSHIIAASTNGKGLSWPCLGFTPCWHKSLMG